MLYRVHLYKAGIRSFLDKGADCVGSWQSNYNTTTTVPTCLNTSDTHKDPYSFFNRYTRHSVLSCITELWLHSANDWRLALRIGSTSTDHPWLCWNMNIISVIPTMHFAFQFIHVAKMLLLFNLDDVVHPFG